MKRYITKINKAVKKEKRFRAMAGKGIHDHYSFDGMFYRLFTNT
jgi:hypothetical protein